MNVASIKSVNFASQTASFMQNVSANSAQQTALFTQHVSTSFAAQIVLLYQHVFIQMIDYYMIFMSLFNQSETLYFDEQNVTEFLKHFEKQC